MEKTCLKCGAVADPGDEPFAACPRCGAIYRKVEEAVAQREQKAAAERGRLEHIERERASAERAKAASRADYEARTNDANALRDASRRDHLLKRGVVCTSCGTLGSGKRATRGSLGLEVALWAVGLLTLVFAVGVVILVVALIYSLWRMFSRQRVCTSCGASTLVPASSPVAQQMLRQTGQGS